MKTTIPMTIIPINFTRKEKRDIHVICYFDFGVRFFFNVGASSMRWDDKYKGDCLWDSPFALFISSHTATKRNINVVYAILINCEK